MILIHIKLYLLVISNLILHVYNFYYVSITYIGDLLFLIDVGYLRKNKANRAKQVIKHTSGSKSYAQIRYEQVGNLLLI